MKTIKNLSLALLLSFTIAASSEVKAMQQINNEDESHDIRVAQQWIQSKSFFVQSCALQMFGELVRNGQGFEAALAAAQQGMLSKSSWVQSQALRLFGELVRNGLTIKEALDAAQQGVQSCCKNIRNQAEELQKIIVYKYVHGTVYVYDMV